MDVASLLSHPILVQLHYLISGYRIQSPHPLLILYFCFYRYHRNTLKLLDDCNVNKYYVNLRFTRFVFPPFLLGLPILRRRFDVSSGSVLELFTEISANFALFSCKMSSALNLRFFSVFVKMVNSSSSFGKYLLIF